MGDNVSASHQKQDTIPTTLRRPRLSFMNIVVDVVRHAVPLLCLYVLQHDIATYILLTAFDLSLGLMFIVGTTRASGDINSVDPRSRWLIFRLVSILVVAIFLAIVAAIITIPVGMPAFIFGLYAGIDWRTVMSNPGFWMPIGGMSLLAAARYQNAFEARTTPGDRGQPTNKGPVIGNLEEDRKNSLAAYAAQVTFIGTFAFLCYVLITFGHWGLNVLPVLYAGLLVFYDIRPDIAQRIFPKLWQKK
jgi:hypothetical protein